MRGRVLVIISLLFNDEAGVPVSDHARTSIYHRKSGFLGYMSYLSAWYLTGRRFWYAESDTSIMMSMASIHRRHQLEHVFAQHYTTLEMHCMPHSTWKMH
ncbi:hypothetical protein F5Y18DRAFT_367424 [Xylariaceae sp. FL1019]|nr:hypothetical protein F5Y18DRAFT_367424 [Xylariaceae sp. FL1019]